MTRPSPKILLIDPLTLLGREMAALMPRYPELVEDLHYLHTSEEDEHQIAELAGQAALVSPLTGPDDLEGFAAIVVASEKPSKRLAHLKRFLRRSPEAPVIVLGHGLDIGARGRPVTGHPGSPTPTGLVRVAHPALVAAVHLVEPLRRLEAVAAAVAAIDPVSSFGGDAVEVLAVEAARRLQGGEAEETIAGRTLAFNLVTLDPEELARDAAGLFPGLETTFTRTVAGVFHGHAVHLTVAFARPTSAAEVEALWQAAPGLDVVEPLVLNEVVETDAVVVSRPRLSGAGTLLAATAMFDGLRLGGALTALEVLRSIGVPPPIPG